MPWTFATKFRFPAASGDPPERIALTLICPDGRVRDFPDWAKYGSEQAFFDLLERKHPECLVFRINWGTAIRPEDV